MDNFNLVEKLLSFDDTNDFYHIQIFKRRKENPDLERNSIVIKNYIVNSLNEYRKIQSELIGLCTYENARAYIRVNKRNFKVIAHKMNRLLAEYLETEQYIPISNLFDKVVGRYHSDPDKKWIIDVDLDQEGVDINLLNHYADFVTELQKETKKEPFIFTVPTPNGYHLITRPFNVKKFKEKYPEVDLHKDRLTLLFIPN